MAVKPTTLLAALALLGTALALVPATQAMEYPPQCQTIGGGCCGIEPAFAPCCTVLSCPPPVARCPESRVATSDFLAYLGPHASVATHYDCSADACNDLTASCCSVERGATTSACGSLAVCESPPVPILMSTRMMAIPVPTVSYTINPDCSVTVTESYDCPNGFWDATIYYTAGPVHLVADNCQPMCACMPQEILAAEGQG